MKISVVLATYNGARFLDSQLKSIIKQSLVPNEVIICDDRSTDNTIEMLEDLQKQFNLKILRSEVNRGLIQNFKWGISKVPSDHFIALCDQDDIWEKDKLQLNVEAITCIDTPDIPCMTYSDLMVIDEHEKIKEQSFWHTTGRGNYEHCLETLLFGNFVSGCTMLMNPALRQFSEDIPNSLKQNHDSWLALVAFSMGKVSALDRPLVKYRQHSTNVTYNTTHNKRKNLYRKIQKHIRFTINPREYLSPQFELVGKFYNTYKDHPLFQHHELFLKFLNLQGKSYIVQKLAMKRSFDSYWK